MRFDKILLVCSEDSDGVENCLVDAGCDVIRVPEGAEAVARILRETFDAAVILSTGEKMDLVETALNLIDIRGSMPIIIVDDRANRRYGMFARFVPNAKVVTVRELEGLLRQDKR